MHKANDSVALTGMGAHIQSMASKHSDGSSTCSKLSSSPKGEICTAAPGVYRRSGREPSLVRWQLPRELAAAAVHVEVLPRDVQARVRHLKAQPHHVVVLVLAVHLAQCVDGLGREIVVWKLVNGSLFVRHDGAIHVFSFVPLVFVPIEVAVVLPYLPVEVRAVPVPDLTVAESAIARPLKHCWENQVAISSIGGKEVPRANSVRP